MASNIANQMIIIICAVVADKSGVRVQSCVEFLCVDCL